MIVRDPDALLAGLVIVAPVVGDVPGVPTAMGALVVLTTAQMLLRREHIWMPSWGEERAAARTAASSNTSRQG